MDTTGIHLAGLRPKDQLRIHGWPPYPQEFHRLDYALREGGWLDLFPPAPTTRRFAAWRGDQLVGFSLLVDITPETAEFYIAVHPEHLGEGLGKPITRLTISHGFDVLGLAHIHLKVRTWHQRGMKLYSRYGFEPGPIVHDMANGELVEFLKMDVSRERWERLREDRS